MALLSAFSLLSAGVARADTVRLLDGTTLRGRAVRIGERVEVFGFSGVQTVPLARVATVEMSSPARTLQAVVSRPASIPLAGIPPASISRARPERTPRSTTEASRRILDPQGLFQRAWAFERLGRPGDASSVRRLALSEELSERARRLLADDDAGWAHLELLALLGGLEPALVSALRRRALAVDDLVTADSVPSIRRTWSGPPSLRGPRGRVVVIYPRSSRTQTRRPVQRRPAQFVVFGGAGFDRGSRPRSRPRRRRPGGLTVGAAYGQGRRTFGAARGGRSLFDAIRSQRSVTFGAGHTQGRVTFRRARVAGGPRGR